MKKKEFEKQKSSVSFNQLISLGSNALQAKDYNLAERCLKQAISINPANISASYLYGVSLKFLNKPAKALKYIASAINDGINDAAAFYQYGELLLILKKPEQAKQQLRKALAIKNDFVQAAFFLANIYYEQFQFEEAEKYYLRVLEVSQDHWQARYNIAHIYYKQFNYPKALIYLKKCIEIHAENSLVYAEIANIYEQLNDIENAKIFAEKALFYDANNVDAKVTQVKCLRREKLWQNGLDILETLDVMSQPSEIQVRFWAEKGKLYERTHQYDQAFSAFSYAKKHLKVVQQHFPYTDLFQVINRSQQMMEHPSYRNLLDEKDQFIGSEKKIIFIVGFFRSGTTLLEKMLASHKDIVSAGELDALVRIEKKAAAARLLNMPENERSNWINENQEAYYHEAEKKGLTQSELSLFIDKAPFNIARLPLIRLLFPNALVIRVLRHPLDIAISCFSEAFGNRYDWSYTLQDTIKLIKAVDEHYDEVVAENLGIDCLQIRYEDLVQNPQAIINQILLKLNKSWDDNCLSFYQKSSHTYTASYEQVTKPLYTSSIGRYENYLKFYKPDSLTAVDSLLKKQLYTL